ncbi:Neurotransmitter-gated ion-channel ligand binding domain protein [Ancylostoma caninum]|uniref:Neurotransmitter-gated ion-channel ligand binding domain protein n=1 Tax=Ancylostoma caninum TaxID=29170 RepID=A0A368G175_ANCCA|nr:Neurotransmitter-gated ion-channel ligand binding domain protein [Ancylostoma caninum]
MVENCSSVVTCEWGLASTLLDYFFKPLLKQLLRNKQLLEQSTDGTEERLYRSLLSPDRYEKDVRPTTHHSKPTNVTFGFLLNQIVEMDERNQVLTTRSWLNINWIDQRLMWNHSQWEGIKTIYIPHQRLWKPDIILVNKSVYFKKMNQEGIVVGSMQRLVSSCSSKVAISAQG